MKLTGAERARAKKVTDTTKPQHFDASGRPLDTIGAVMWANMMAAELLEKVMKNEGNELTFKEQLRYAGDLIAKIGLTSSKAVQEEHIIRLEKRAGIAKGQHDEDGLEEDTEGK